MTKRDKSLVGINYRNHKASERIMKHIHDLRTHGVVGPHAYGQIIIGPSGVGKSALLQHYCAKYPPRETEFGIVRPVIYVEAPEKCTISTLAEELLRALDEEGPSSGTEGTLVARVVQALIDQLVELVIIDEGQQMLGIDGFKVGNFFKQVLNKAKRPVVIAGMSSLLNLKGLNKQFRGRQRGEIRMSAFDWFNDSERKRLLLILKALEDMMMFELDGFHLDEPAIAMRLAFGSQGLLRDITNYILAAEQIGRMEELEKLTLETFTQGWRSLNQDADPATNPFTSRLPDTWTTAPETTGERDPVQPKRRHARKAA